MAPETAAPTYSPVVMETIGAIEHQLRRKPYGVWCAEHDTNTGRNYSDYVTLAVRQYFERLGCEVRTEWQMWPGGKLHGIWVRRKS
jgi:hypothetical protein